MDTFSADRKLSELGDLDLQDFLIDQPNDLVFGGRHAGEAGRQTGSGMSSRHQDLNGDCSEYTCYKMDSGWLDNFLDDDETSGCVTTVANYNDVLTTSGLEDESLQQQQQPEHVKCEHSYSLADDNNMEDQLLSCLPSCNAPSSPHAHDEINFDIKTEADEMDMDAGLFNLINPDLTLLADSDASTCSGSDVDCDGIQTSPTMVAAPVDVFQSVFTSCSSEEDCDDLMMNGQVKTEPLDVCTTGGDEDGSFTTIESDFFDVPDMLDLPPTPPSSSSCSSDSEAGGLSPRRSSPSSPIHLPPYQTRTHHVLLSGHHHHQHQHHQQQQLQHSGNNMWTASGSSSSSSGSQSLFSSPIPSSGILVLSEEEKRTLVAEGYPIPTKLPLTKQEEKNLKKIRRKIKNKISAQESRRKKKEYLEHLEKRVELVSMENLTLRKKLDALETNNRSLASQLQKLQSLASRVTAEMQAATCITVS